MKIRLLYIIGSTIAIALLIYSSFPKNIKSDTFVRGISFIYVVNYDYVAHSTMGLGKDEFFIDFKNRLIYEFQIEYSHYYIFMMEDMKEILIRYMKDIIVFQHSPKKR